MGNRPPFVIVLDGEAEAEGCPAGRTIIDLELSAYGQRLRRRLAVADAPARLADVVPFAHRLTDEIAQQTVRAVEQAGLIVPCRRGCATCCRYLVSLSVPEAYCLADQVRAMPAGRQQELEGRLRHAAVRVATAGPPDVPQGADSDALDSDELLQRVGQWYEALHLDCPLLSDEACTCYDRRPVSCRNYLVAVPPGQDGTCPTAQTQRIAPPVNVLQALCRLASETDQTDLQAVMLPMVLEWVGANEDRGRHTWPAAELVGRFAGILHDLAEEAGAESASDAA